MRAGDRCLARYPEITGDRFMPGTVQAVRDTYITVEFDSGELQNVDETQIMDRAKTEKLIKAEEKARKRMQRAHHRVRNLVDNKKKFNPTTLRPRIEAYDRATEAYIAASEALDVLL